MKSIWKLLLVCCCVMPMQAKASSFDDAYDLYQVDLKHRTDMSSHVKSLFAAMQNFAGQKIIGQDVEGRNITIIWDDKVRAFIDSTEVPLVPGIDGFGRVTFQSNAVHGWLDFLDPNIHMNINAFGQNYRIISTRSIRQQSPVATVKKCLCGDTEAGCPGGYDDCRNQQPCTNALCNVKDVVPTKPTGPCGGSVAMFSTLSFGGILFMKRRK